MNNRDGYWKFPSLPSANNWKINMKKLMTKVWKIFIDIILDVIRGIAFIFIISPFIINWFIHGDYDRYRWILSGPYPFSSFGGGPFQLRMYVISIFVGILLFAFSTLLKIVIGRRSYGIRYVH